VQPYHAGVPIRVLLLAEKERALVDAVDDPITRWLASGESQQRGEHVRDVHHFIAFDSRLDSAGPTDQERRADAAFRRAEIRSVEKAACSSSDQVILGSVVAAVNNYGIVGNPEFVELVEQHAEVVVEHQ